MIAWRDIENRYDVEARNTFAFNITTYNYLDKADTSVQMTSVFKYIYVTSTTFLSSIANMVGTAETSETLERSWTPVTAYESSRYSPSVSDVLEVKAILSKNFDLPIELIDSIIDTAEYWPHTSTVTNHATMIRAQRDRENEFIVSEYTQVLDHANNISYDHTLWALNPPNPKTKTCRCFPNTSPHTPEWNLNHGQSHAKYHLMQRKKYSKNGNRHRNLVVNILAEK